MRREGRYMKHSGVCTKSALTPTLVCSSSKKILSAVPRLPRGHLCRNWSGNPHSSCSKEAVVMTSSTPDHPRFQRVALPRHRATFSAGKGTTASAAGGPSPAAPATIRSKAKSVAPMWLVRFTRRPSLNTPYRRVGRARSAERSPPPSPAARGDPPSPGKASPRVRGRRHPEPEAPRKRSLQPSPRGKK